MSQGALKGIRVVDFGHVWAGPYCAQILADMGAEVIKVESKKRTDVHRRQGPYPGGVPGLNRSGVWNAQNRGKLSCTIDLTHPEGASLAKRLVAISDVVIENFSPRVMQKLGLDYENLKLVKPDIIMLSLSAFGHTGPQRDYVGYGPSIDAWAGLDYLTGYPDGPPESLGGMFPDTASALYGAFAVLVALYNREKSSEGQYIDVSQMEVSINLIADALVEQAVTGKNSGRLGNSHPFKHPHGCYPCQGEDKWIAIAVESEEEWVALCRVMNRPDLATDPRYADPASRQQHREELDTLISFWTSQFEPYRLMELLQASGVAAGPSLNVPELLADPHLKERRAFWELDHPEVGRQIVYGPCWRLSATPGGISQPAPLLGEDNDYVFRQLLGLTEGEIARLEKKEII
ncbi:MAG: hypothetical protein PWP65_81 [Clostridia bacterium]|nr:hypothetical protein [Clostridia bacterium]